MPVEAMGVNETVLMVVNEMEGMGNRKRTNERIVCLRFVFVFELLCCESGGIPYEYLAKICFNFFSMPPKHLRFT